MLTKVRVQGFKAIFDTKTLELPPLAVFLGRNGSGKSSLLEALQWLQESIWDGIQAATRSRFVSFKDLINRRAGKIALDLEFSNTRYYLEVGATRPDDSYGVLTESCSVGKTVARREEIETKAKNRREIVGGVPVRDRDTLALSLVRGTKARGASSLLSFFRRAVFLRLSPTLIARPGPLALPAKGPILDELGSNLPALLKSLAPPQKEKVLLGLQEALAGSAKIEKVAVIENDLTQSGTVALEERMRSRGGTKAYRLPAWVLSEGTRRLTAIYTLLAMKPPPSLIAIEEIENGLDPWTLVLVLEALKRAAENGVQIILTTHSPYFLDRLDPDQVFHVVRRQGDSSYRLITEYKEVADYEGVVPPGVMYLSDYFEDKAKDKK